MAYCLGKSNKLKLIEQDQFKVDYEMVEEQNAIFTFCIC